MPADLLDNLLSSLPKSSAPPPIPGGDALDQLLGELSAPPPKPAPAVSAPVVPGMEKLGALPGVPTAPLPPGLTGPPVRERGVYRGEPIEAAIPRAGEPTMRQVMQPALTGTLPEGYNVLAPAEGDTDLDSIQKGVAQLALGIGNAKAFGMMLAAAGLTSGLRAAANLPQVARALSGYPHVLKGLDIASAAAVPAAFTGLNVGGAGKAGVAAYEAAQRGQRPAAVQYGTEALGNAILAGLGLAGTISAGRGVSGAYPEPATPEATARAVEVGGIAGPKVAPGEAAAKAATLTKAGRRLAAEYWKGVDPNSPVQIVVDGSPALLHPPATLASEGRAYTGIQVTDLQGNPIHADTPAGMVGWLQRHAATRPATVPLPGAVPGTGPVRGILPTGEVQPALPSPVQLPAAERPTPAPLPPGPEGAPARGAVPSPAPSAPPAATPSGPAPAIAKGAVFELPSGKYTVSGANKDRISFTREDATGKKVAGTLPVETFRDLVASTAPKVPTQDALDQLLGQMPAAAPETPAKAPSAISGIGTPPVPPPAQPVPAPPPSRGGLTRGDEVPTKAGIYRVTDVTADRIGYSFVPASGGTPLESSMPRVKFEGLRKSAGASTAEPEPPPLLRPQVEVPEGQPAEIAAERLGAAGETATVRGTKVGFQWAVVPLDAPVVSHGLAGEENPAYPAAAQPRQRGRAAAQAQYAEIGGRLDYGHLGPNALVNFGAPVVGADLVTEAGSGRLNALRWARQYRPELYNQYKADVRADAKRLGIAPEALDRVGDFALVRVRRSPVNRVQFAREANEDPQLGMSPAEVAQVDAGRLAGLLPHFNADAEITAPENRDFVRGFMAHVAAPGERARLQTSEGALSKSGVDRIRNAIFAHAYGDPSAIETLAEAPDDPTKAITAGMLRAAPALAKVREGIRAGALHDVDISPDVAAAAQKIAWLRRNRTPVEHYLAQQGLLGRDISDEARELLKVFAEQSKSPRRIGDILVRYAAAVEEAGHPGQGELFVGQAPAKSDLLLGAIESVLRKEAAPHAVPAPVPESQRVPGPPRPAPAAPAGRAGGAPEPERQPAPAAGPARTAPAESQLTDEQRAAEAEGYDGRKLSVALMDQAKAAPRPAKPRPKLPPKQVARIERQRDFYTPGNVVTSYGGGLDKVLAYDEGPGGTFRVTVQAVKPDGTIDPQWPEPRRHSTPPGERDRIVSRAPRKETPSESQNQPGLPGAQQQGQAPLEGEPQRVPSGPPPGAGGNVQAPAAAPQGEVTPPQQRLIERIHQAITSAEDIRLNLEAIAEGIYGGTRAAGAFTKRDLYEAQEAAVNHWLRANGPRLLTVEPTAAVAELRAVMAKLATETVRSQEQIDKQQFSTPPTIAWLVDKLAAPRPDAVQHLLDRITGGGTTITENQLYDDVLRNGTRYQLEGGLQVVRGQIARNPVVQIIPPNAEVGRQLEGFGVQYERGVIATYYIPLNPKDTNPYAILRRVLAQYPPRQVGGAVSPSLRRVPPASEGFMRAEYRNGIIWVNQAVLDLLDRYKGEAPQGGSGAQIDAREAPWFRKWLEYEADRARTQREAAPYRDLLRVVDEARNDNLDLVFALRRGSLSEAKAAVRHEWWHRMQEALGGGAAGRHLENVVELLDHPLAEKAEAGLARLGYSTVNPFNVAVEIGAHLVGGPVDWAAIGLSQDEAIEYFEYYADLLYKAHGDRVGWAVRRIHPILRRALKDAEKQVPESGVGRGRAAGPVGVYQGAPGQPGVPRGAPEGVRVAARRGEQERLFEPGEQTAGQAEYEAELLGERLTAEFRSPLNAGNLRKPLKPAPAPAQADLFRGLPPEAGQGRLFGRRRVVESRRVPEQGGAGEKPPSETTPQKPEGEQRHLTPSASLVGRDFEQWVAKAHMPNEAKKLWDRAQALRAEGDRIDGTDLEALRRAGKTVTSPDFAALVGRRDELWAQARTLVNEFHITNQRTSSRGELIDALSQRFRPSRARAAGELTTEERTAWESVADNQNPHLLTFTERLLSLIRAAEEDLYLRFGDLPSGDRSRNYATGEFEDGVSVYVATPTPPAHRVGVEGIAYSPTGALPGAALSAALGAYRSAQLLLGEVVGYGGDGEPLLKKPLVVAFLKPVAGTAAWVPSAQIPLATAPRAARNWRASVLGEFAKFFNETAAEPGFRMSRRPPKGGEDVRKYEGSGEPELPGAFTSTSSSQATSKAVSFQSTPTKGETTPPIEPEVRTGVKGGERGAAPEPQGDLFAGMPPEEAQGRLFRSERRPGVRSEGVPEEGGAGEQPPPETTPPKPGGARTEFDLIAEQIAPHGWASKAQIAAALRERGLLDPSGRNVGLLREAIARRKAQREAEQTGAEDRRRARYIDEARQVVTRDEFDSDAAYEQAVNEEAGRLADEAEVSAQSAEYDAASVWQRIERGVARPRDYTEALAERIEEQTGIRASYSRSSEAVYFEAGAKKLRIASHAARPTYEQVFGAADVDLRVGGDLGEATHSLPEGADVSSVEAMAREMAEILNRWQGEEASRFEPPRRPPEGGISFARRAPREEGAPPPTLADLVESFRRHWGNSDGLREFYSSKGFAQDVFVRNLSQLIQASPRSHTAAIRAASHRSQASTIIWAAMPAISQTLEGSGVSPEEFRLALIESRLLGRREFYGELADAADRATDDELRDGFDEDFAWVLRNIEGRRTLPTDLAQTAAALVETQDWDTLRAYLNQVFTDAAAAVQTVMERPWYDAVTGNGQFPEALRLYKELVEKPMRENHLLNEGVLSERLGPLDTYYPLIPLEREPIGPAGRRLPYHKPRNIASQFATGLAEGGYDPGMEAFRERLAGAVRGNDKAALLQVLEEEGWLAPLARGEDAGVFVAPDGTQYRGSKVERSPARIVIKEGKGVHLPPTFGVVPRWLWWELKPILEGDRPLPNWLPLRIVGLLNWMSLLGPPDAVWHTHNLFGTLVANTPFLGATLQDRALSAPLVKKFGSIIKVLDTDPTEEEAKAAFIEMAKLGVIPTRAASETYSRKLAEEIGAEYKRPFQSFAPLLYGPRGIDLRARLLMWRIAKAVNPNATPQELYLFVNQLGNYTPELQGIIERFLKRFGVSQFFTAGSTMLRNGLNALAGTGPMPRKGIDLRIYQQLTGGTLVTVALWMVLYQAVTGKWPTDDRRAKLLDIPVGGGNGPIDKWRHSVPGNALWGPGSEVGYLGFGFFNPLVKRGARGLGLTGGFNTLVAGGSGGQAASAAAADILNAWAHPALGPPTRAVFVGLGGVEPYLLGWRDRGGRFAGPQFYPAIPPRTKPGWPEAWQRGWRAANELNGFYASLGEATGLNAMKDQKGNAAVRMLIDLSFPGAVLNASNPYSRAERLRQQRAGTR